MNFKDGQTAGDVEELINRAEAMATTRRTDDDAVTAQDIPEVEDTVADSGEEDQETPESIVEEATVEACRMSPPMTMT